MYDKLALIIPRKLSEGSLYTVHTLLTVLYNEYLRVSVSQFPKFIIIYSNYEYVVTRTIHASLEAYQINTVQYKINKSWYRNST